MPQNPPIGCWVGNWLALNAEGDLSVCPVLLDELSTGNVREKPIDQLVYESRMFADLTDRSRLKGRCGRCRYQYTCGGCRAMAFYHTGDYLEEDPTCFFDPVDETTVCEHEEETNRLFKKYLIVARHAGFYERPGKKAVAEPAPQPAAERAPRNGNGSNGGGAKQAPGRTAAHPEAGTSQATASTAAAEGTEQAQAPSEPRQGAS